MYLPIDSGALTEQLRAACASLGVAAGVPTWHRSPSRRGGGRTTKHLVTFGLTIPGLSLPDGLTPMIGFYNSYQGEAALRVFGGALRAVCANGCVFGTPQLDVRIRHVDGPKARTFLADVHRSVEHIVAGLRALGAQVTRWQALQVSDPLAVVTAAVDAGLVTATAAELARHTIAGRSAWARPEDVPTTAWGLYNILNESTRLAGRSGVRSLLRDPGILAHVLAHAA